MYFEQKEGILSLGADFKPICICYNYKDCKQELGFEAKLKNTLLILPRFEGKETRACFSFWYMYLISMLRPFPF
jgi:hypothetical protein